LLTGSEEVRPAVAPELPERWAKLLRREQVDFLPHALDAEIRRFDATATSGPPTTQPPLDVEELVAAWRRTRGEQGSA